MSRNSDPCLRAGYWVFHLVDLVCVLSVYLLEYWTAVRYPDDSLDRLWVTDRTQPTIQSSVPVDVERLDDSPPVSVVQTSYVASSNAGFYLNLTYNMAGTSYLYYVAFYFAEVDAHVNASGLRVFDIWVNGRSFSSNVDVYNKVGLYSAYEVYSPKPLGPYSNYVLINVTSTPSSVYPPFISAAEILQLFDNPMLPPTSSVDSKLATLFSSICWNYFLCAFIKCVP